MCFFFFFLPLLLLRVDDAAAASDSINATRRSQDQKRAQKVLKQKKWQQNSIPTCARFWRAQASRAHFI
jgi:hypothetical protein